MVTQLGLFGEEYEPGPIRKSNDSPYQAWKKQNLYRLSSSDEIRCQNCKWLDFREGYKKKFYKCKLLGMSKSIATDIRLNHVCNLFEKKIINGT